MQKSVPIIQYENGALQIFKSIDMEPSKEELKKVIDFLKGSENWTNTQIRLTEIIVNTRNKELLLKTIELLNKDQYSRYKKEILNLIAKLSEEKNKEMKINRIFEILEQENVIKTIKNYEKIGVIEPILFQIGRISVKKDSKVNEVLQSINQERVLNIIANIKNNEKRKIVAGEMVYLILNSEKTDFEKLINQNINEIIDKIKEEYNITHFGRYSAKTIMYLYELTQDSLKGLDKADKIKKGKAKKEQIFVFTYPYYDYNGAFYNDSKNTDYLLDKGKTLIVEASSDVELSIMLEKMQKKHGYFDTIFIGGHGEPTKITLGSENKLYSYMDVTDYDIMEKIGNLMNKENRNRSIVLVSCSTGDESSTRSIANIMASTSQVAHVFAPETTFSKYTIKMNKNKNIEIAYATQKEIVPTMEFGIGSKKREE